MIIIKIKNFFTNLRTIIVIVILIIFIILFNISKNNRINNISSIKVELTIIDDNYLQGSVIDGNNSIKENEVVNIKTHYITNSNYENYNISDIVIVEFQEVEEISPVGIIAERIIKE